MNKNLSSEKQFFVSCALGMEQEVALELQEVWPELLDLDGRPHGSPLAEVVLDKGGVAFSAPFHLGLQLNYFLRLPHRILLRLKEFRCRDFPKLFAETQKLPLKEYSQSSEWELEVAASQSRLNHEGRIEDTLRKALKLSKGSDQGSAGRIFVRFFDDTCTVSLDTTGEHLHFRGGDLNKGDAPLRETLATYCLRRMTDGLSQAEILNIQWYDPMMGSGTFLLEASQLFSMNTKRKFAFQSWLKTPKAFKSDAWIRNYSSQEQCIKKIFGSDIDPKMVNVARDNFAKQGLSLPKLTVSDLFAGPAPFEFDSKYPLWVVMNPPYGERIKASFSAQELLDTSLKNLNPDRLGILFSKRQTQNLNLKTKGYQLLEQVPLSNGGLPCLFLIFKKSV